MPTHEPNADSSSAVAAQASALREDTMTVAPPAMKPPAIIRPMPRVPPVTTTTLPSTEKRSASGVGGVASVMAGDRIPRQRRWQVGQCVVPRASRTAPAQQGAQRGQGSPARP